MGEWILDGKITIDDLPKDVRRTYYHTVYGYAFRRLRGLHQVRAYVHVMELLWEDMKYTQKQGKYLEAQKMLRRLFDAYWGVELLFKGEEEFEALVQTLAKHYPDLFGED
ncbi:hypothetical protein [Lactococcus petauri]|uniref:hypothetical protein n=1 Tax=Lactococcus petauri TaxID=1940789 RepID=UPI001F5A07EB|nr:hypothetical protein [Lactococcus petauri]